MWCGVFLSHPPGDSGAPERFDRIRAIAKSVGILISTALESTKVLPNRSHESTIVLLRNEFDSSWSISDGEVVSYPYLGAGDPSVYRSSTLFAEVLIEVQRPTKSSIVLSFVDG